MIRIMTQLKVCTVLLVFALIYPHEEGRAAGTAKFSDNQICRAGIAVAFGRDPAIIRIGRARGGIIYLSYIRPDDGKKWSFRCKIQSNRIIWASDTGRWRTHPEDSVITYSIAGSMLFVSEKYSDGSATSGRYRVADFGDEE